MAIPTHQNYAKLTTKVLNFEELFQGVPDILDLLLGKDVFCQVKVAL